MIFVIDYFWVVQVNSIVVKGYYCCLFVNFDLVFNQNFVLYIGMVF